MEAVPRRRRPRSRLYTYVERIRALALPFSLYSASHFFFHEFPSSQMLERVSRVLNIISHGILIF